MAFEIAMKELLDKITSYNLFNYLLPGVLFSVLARAFTELDLIQDDLITGAFLYYFIGIIVSRFGSLFFEPFLKWSKFVRFEKYEDYLLACEKDSKIELLLETSNMYRTFAALFASLLFLKIYLAIETALPALGEYRAWIAIIFLLALFLFSYRKQTKYIASRIRKFSDE